MAYVRAADGVELERKDPPIPQNGQQTTASSSLQRSKNSMNARVRGGDHVAADCDFRVIYVKYAHHDGSMPRDFVLLTFKEDLTQVNLRSISYLPS